MSDSVTLPSSLTPTKLSYLDDSYKFHGSAKVIAVVSYGENQTAIVLDQTIFYPQGGGQPFDTGRIESDQGTFEVTEVRFDAGVVYHVGRMIAGGIEPDNTVKLIVDEARRRLHCRLHSAGHMIDVALRNLNQTLIPGKGYHFAEGSYVEYAGVLQPEQRDLLQVTLEQEVSKLISASTEVKVQEAVKSELPALCDFVPDYIPPDKPTRVVTMASTRGCPCGGTHVKNTSEIGEIKISKIRCKGGNTRVSYKLVENI